MYVYVVVGEVFTDHSPISEHELFANQMLLNTQPQHKRNNTQSIIVTQKNTHPTPLPLTQ